MPDSLIQAQIENQKAQAKYYSRQSDRRGFWRSLREFGWPCGALLVGGAAIGAVLLGQRSNQRLRSDAEFYEAIKRFGQSENAASRQTAATSLADMGVRSNRFFESAFDQLSLQFLSEPQEHVQNAVLLGVSRLAKKNPGRAIEKLDNLNRILRISLAESLYAFFISLGGDPPENVTEEAWIQAEQATGFEREALRRLMNELPEDRLVSLRKSAGKPPGDCKDRPHDDLVKALANKAALLRSNIRSIGESLNYGTDEPAVFWGTGFPDRESVQRSFSSTFLAYGEFRTLQSSRIRGAVLRRAKLAGANLERSLVLAVDLSGADMSYANLCFVDCRDTKLTGAVLRHADLRGARIQNTDLAGADLTGTIFRNTIIAPAAFQGTEWWKADFGRERKLLKAVYARLKDELPDLEDVYVRGDIHRSVLDFIGKITEERL